MPSSPFGSLFGTLGQMPARSSTYGDEADPWEEYLARTSSYDEDPWRLPRATEHLPFDYTPSSVTTPPLDEPPPPPPVEEAPYDPGPYHNLRVPMGPVPIMPVFAEPPEPPPRKPPALSQQIVTTRVTQKAQEEEKKKKDKARDLTEEEALGVPDSDLLAELKAYDEAKAKKTNLSKLGTTAEPSLLDMALAEQGISLGGLTTAKSAGGGGWADEAPTKPLSFKRRGEADPMRTTVPGRSDKPLGPETTVLTPKEERRFQQWAVENHITDLDHPQSYYDYRGFWKENPTFKRGAGQHLTDKFKQHGHPLFSEESQYSTGKGDGGTWDGEIYVTPDGRRINMKDPYAAASWERSQREPTIGGAPPPAPRVWKEETIGTRPAPPAPPAPPPTTAWGKAKASAADALRFAKSPTDVGLALASGAVTLGQAAVGFADLAMLGANPQLFAIPAEHRPTLGKWMQETLGYSSEETKKFFELWKTPEQQEAGRRLEKAKTGFSVGDQDRIDAIAQAFIDGGIDPEKAKAAAAATVDKDLSVWTYGKRAVDYAIAALQNPSKPLESVVESIPLMFAGGAVSRAAEGVLSAAAAGGFGEGFTQYLSARESFRESNPGGHAITPAQEAAAAASGAADMVIGMFGSRLADRFGVKDVDTLFLAAAKDKKARSSLLAIFKAMPLAAVQEGFFEEAPQSLLEKVAENVAWNQTHPDDQRAWHEGLTEDVLMGLFSGALMGAGAQVAHGGGQAAATVFERHQRATFVKEVFGTKDPTLDELVDKRQDLQRARQSARTPEAAAQVQLRVDALTAIIKEKLVTQLQPDGSEAKILPPPVARAGSGKPTQGVQRQTPIAKNVEEVLDRGGANKDGWVSADQFSIPEQEKLQKAGVQYQTRMAEDGTLSQVFNEQQLRAFSQGHPFGRKAATGRATAFVTRQGTYTVEGVDGTSTMRVQTAEDAAPHDPSDRTVYLAPEDAQRVERDLTRLNAPASGLTATPLLDGDGSVILLVKETATGKVRSDLSQRISTSEVPAAGLHPFELWEKTNASEKRWQFGSLITNVATEPVARTAEPTAPPAQARPAGPPPPPGAPPGGPSSRPAVSQPNAAVVPVTPGPAGPAGLAGGGPPEPPPPGAPPAAGVSPAPGAPAAPVPDIADVLVKEGAVAGARWRKGIEGGAPPMSPTEAATVGLGQQAARWRQIRDIEAQVNALAEDQRGPLMAEASALILDYENTWQGAKKYLEGVDFAVLRERIEASTSAPPPAPAAPAAPPVDPNLKTVTLEQQLPGWLGTLPKEHHEPVFAVMRRIGEMAQAYHDEARRSTAPQGTIGVGMADRAAFQQADTRDEFLRQLRNGATPEQAAEIAKKHARFIAQKANATRPRDIHSHLGESAVDASIDDAMRAIMRAVPAAAAPAPAGKIDLKAAADALAESIRKRKAQEQQPDVPRWRPDSEWDKPGSDPAAVLARVIAHQTQNRVTAAQLQAESDALPEGSPRKVTLFNKIQDLQTQHDEQWLDLDAEMTGINIKALTQQVQTAADVATGKQQLKDAADEAKAEREKEQAKKAKEKEKEKEKEDKKEPEKKKEPEETDEQKIARLMKGYLEPEEEGEAEGEPEPKKKAGPAETAVRRATEKATSEALTAKELADLDQEEADQVAKIRSMLHNRPTAGVPLDLVTEIAKLAGIYVRRGVVQFRDAAKRFRDTFGEDARTDKYFELAWPIAQARAKGASIEEAFATAIAMKDRPTVAAALAEDETETEDEAEDEEEQPARGARRRIAGYSGEGSALEGALSPEAQAGVARWFNRTTRARDLSHIREAMEVYEGLIGMDSDEAQDAAEALRDATEAFFLEETHANADALDAAAYRGLQVATGREDADWGELAERNVMATARDTGQLVFETLDPQTASFDVEEFNSAYNEVEFRREQDEVFPKPQVTVNLRPGRPVRKKKGQPYAGLRLRNGVPVLSNEEGAAKIEEWKAEAKRLGETQDNSRKIIISLYDRTGIISQPWADAGYSVRRFDVRPVEHGGTAEDLIDFHIWMEEIEEMINQGYQIVGVLAQPPCTSFTRSGQSHWPDKHDAPNYKDKDWPAGLSAEDRQTFDQVGAENFNWLVKTYGARAAEYFDTPVDYANTLVAIVKLVVAQANPRFYAMENPAGRIDELHGLPGPTLVFNPDDYGEPYTKETQIWGEFNPKLPLARVGGRKEEGGEGSRTWNESSARKDERSLTAVGFSYAFFMANQGLAQEEWQNQEHPGREEPAPGQKYEPFAPPEQDPELLKLRLPLKEQEEGAEDEDEEETEETGPPPVIAFRSGNQTAINDLVGFINAGQDVGVTALGMTGPVEDAIVKHVIDGGNAFIDSGAFGKTTIVDGRGVSTVDFKAVLLKYGQLAMRIKAAGGVLTGLYVVAPDVAPAWVDPNDRNKLLSKAKGGVPRSFPEETKEIQDKYADAITNMQEALMAVIVPVQVGPEMSARAIEVAKQWPGVQIGLPGNEGALTDAQLTDMLDAMAAVEQDTYGFHFLGIGENNPRFKPLLNIIHQHPFFGLSRTDDWPVITTDSSRAQAYFGEGRKGTKTAEHIADTAARDRMRTREAHDPFEISTALFDDHNLDAFSDDEVTMLMRVLGAESREQLQQWLDERETKPGSEPTLEDRAGDYDLEEVIWRLAYARARAETPDSTTRTQAITRLETKVTPERQAVVDLLSSQKPEPSAAVLADPVRHGKWKREWAHQNSEFKRRLVRLSDYELVSEARLWSAVRGSDALMVFADTLPPEEGSERAEMAAEDEKDRLARAAALKANAPFEYDIDAWRAEQREMGADDESIEAAIQEAASLGIDPTRSDDLYTLGAFIESVEEMRAEGDEEGVQDLVSAGTIDDAELKAWAVAQAARKPAQKAVSQPPVSRPQPSSTAAPWQMTRRDFAANHPDALSVPSGSILAMSPEAIIKATPKELAKHSRSELQALAQVVGSPISGTKAVIIARLKAMVAARQAVSQATPETLDAMSKNELLDLGEGLGGSRQTYLNKYALRVTILNRREELRRTGKANLADARHRLEVEQALKAGKAVPAEVLADYPGLTASGEGTTEEEGATDVQTTEETPAQGDTQPPDQEGRRVEQEETVEAAEARRKAQAAIASGHLPLTRDTPVGSQVVDHFDGGKVGTLMEQTPTGPEVRVATKIPGAFSFDLGVYVEGGEAGTSWVVDDDVLGHYSVLPPGAPVPVNRPQRTDGRLIPIAGDKVYQMVPGFGGTPAYIYGEVYQGPKDLRVRITGSASLVTGSGGTGKAKTRALDAHWTVVDDPVLAKRRAAREQAAADKKIQDEREEAEYQAEVRAKAQAAIAGGHTALTRETPVGSTVVNHYTGETQTVEEHGQYGPIVDGIPRDPDEDGTVPAFSVSWTPGVPYSVAALQDAFRLTAAEAKAADVVRVQLQVPENVLRVAKDGIPGEGALKQRTPAFRAWFGDSQVVDANGQPLVVYHGTGQGDITEFQSAAAQGYYHNRGIYFTGKASLASVYARMRQRRGGNAVMYPVYLRIERPYVIERPPTREARRTQEARDRRSSSMHVTAAEVARLREQGYDGIINHDANEYVVFDPTQIKSATANQGTYDPANPNILYQRKPPASRAAKAAKRLRSAIGRITAQGQIDLVTFPTPVEVDERSIDRVTSATHLQMFGDWSGDRFRWLPQNGGTVWWTDRPNDDNLMAVEDRLFSEGLPVARHINIAGDTIERPAPKLYQGAQGAAEFARDGTAIIRGFESANVSTALHELFHVARQLRLNRHVPAERRGGITDADIDGFDAWAGFDTAKTREEIDKAEEKAARGFERYLREGGQIFKDPAVQRVFESIKQWMLTIYASIQGTELDVDITPEVRALFDKLLGADVGWVLTAEGEKRWSAVFTKTKDEKVGGGTKTDPADRRTWEGELGGQQVVVRIMPRPIIEGGSFLTSSNQRISGDSNVGKGGYFLDVEILEGDTPEVRELLLPLVQAGSARPARLRGKNEPFRTGSPGMSVDLPPQALSAAEAESLRRRLLTFNNIYNAKPTDALAEDIREIEAQLMPHDALPPGYTLLGTGQKNRPSPDAASIVGKPASRPPASQPTTRWLNEAEIEHAVERFRDDPVLGPAARFLEAFKDEVNAHSDGWAYWKQPGQAAGQLQALLHAHLFGGMGAYPTMPAATAADVQATLGPIKAFMTKRGTKAGMTLPALPAAPAKVAKAKPTSQPAVSRPVKAKRSKANQPLAAGAIVLASKDDGRIPSAWKRWPTDAERALIFTPGNVVNSYTGTDTVIAYTPPTETSPWSVTVRSNQDPSEGPRTHATEPTVIKDEYRDRVQPDWVHSYTAPAAAAKPAPTTAPVSLATFTVRYGETVTVRPNYAGTDKTAVYINDSPVATYGADGRVMLLVNRDVAYLGMLAPGGSVKNWANSAAQMVSRARLDGRVPDSLIHKAPARQAQLAPEAGRPMTVYHGSAEIARRGGFSGTLRLDIHPYGAERVAGETVDALGTWWTTSRADAAKFGGYIDEDGTTRREGHVVEATITLQNPKVFESAEEWSLYTDTFRVRDKFGRSAPQGAPLRAALEADGHDGFIVRGGGVGDGTPDGADFYLSFDNKGVTLPQAAPPAATDGDRYQITSHVALGDTRYATDIDANGIGWSQKAADAATFDRATIHRAVEQFHTSGQDWRIYPPGNPLEPVPIETIRGYQGQDANDEGIYSRQWVDAGAAAPSITPSQSPAAAKSFKAEVSDGSSFASNALRFATRAEAEAYASDLMSRWMAARESRVVESDDPVANQWADGRVVYLDRKEAADAGSTVVAPEGEAEALARRKQELKDKLAAKMKKLGAKYTNQVNSGLDLDDIMTVIGMAEDLWDYGIITFKEAALAFREHWQASVADRKTDALAEEAFELAWPTVVGVKAGQDLIPALRAAEAQPNRPTVADVVSGAYTEPGAAAPARPPRRRASSLGGEPEPVGAPDEKTAADGDVAGGPKGEPGSDGRGSGPADGADVSDGKKPDTPPQTQPRPGPRNRPRRTVPGPGGDPGLTPGLYTITDADAIGTGTKRERVERNLAAIRLVKQIAQEQRLATPDEQRILVKYVGWGGLSRIFEPWKNDLDDPDDRRADQSRYWYEQHNTLQELLTKEEFKRASNSTQNAHYTSPEVIRAMWAGVERLGITHGSVLEPSSGVGHFAGLMPSSLRGALNWAFVEKDTMTAQIAALLYPDVYTQAMGFEAAQLPDNHFAVAISNVPFGDIPITDRAFQGPSFVKNRIHNYFFGKALDKVAPGGLIAFVTSHGTLDATDTTGQRVREYLAGRADLLGAFRLPFTAFKGTAGTEVVTDIIFMRKRVEGQAPAHAGDWMKSVPMAGLKNKDGETFTHNVNEYFHAHPEMVLGTQDATGKMREANQYNVRPTGVLADQLTEAMARLPENAIDLTPTGPTLEAFTDTVPPLGTRPFELLLHEGRVAEILDGKITPVESLDPYDEARIRGLLPIRAALRDVYAIMADPEADSAALGAAQAQLTKAYDDFVDAYGFISEADNWRPFREDPDIPLLLSLEEYDEERGTADKTAIFTKRTVPAERAARRADTPQLALQLVLGERGRIDLARAGELLGVSAEEAGDQMEAAGLILDTPSGWQLPAQYLSGNVRVKLAEAEAAAKVDPRYETAVERLKAVVPVDIPAYKINVRLGATWIPVEMVTQFVAHVVEKDTSELEWKIFVSPFDAKWGIEGPPRAHVSRFATPDIDTKTLLLAALNDRRPVIRERVPNPNGEGTISVVNAKATVLARQRREEIHKAFTEWLFNADPDRRAWAVRTYNDRFNALVEPHVDGSYLTFPGMSEYWRRQIRPTQRDGIARGLQFGNMLAAWAVGAGKTLWMSGVGMELRRLGLARKPLYVVPNHLISQAPGEFQRYYPNAKLLVARPEDLEKQNRRRFTARIAAGDWDGVMMPISTFVRLSMSAEAETAYHHELLDEVQTAILAEWAAHNEEQAGTRARGRSKRTPPSIKALEKTRDRLQKKLDDLAARPKDDLLTFEELGVDALIIDEAHLFKNLYFHTRQQAAGIPTAENDSQRATDLYLKARYINKQSNYRNVFFATGTPVSNSMAEVYVMQKLLQEQRLEQAGIGNFDAWLGQFGLITVNPELDPSGSGVSNRTRLTDFRNLPDLAQMFRQVTDVKMIDDMPDVKAARPPMETGDVEVVAVPATERQLAYLRELKHRAENLDPRMRHLDNMAKITQDGRASALDHRLIDRTEPDDPKSKINVMVENAAGILEKHKENKGTIVVFMDRGTPGSEVRPATKNVWDPDRGERVDRPLTPEEKLRGFNLYADFKRKIVATGAVTASQVAFIHDIDLLPKEKRDAARKSLFRKVREGDIRVLIGSSDKMGTGMNVQDRLVAELNADPTYKPSETEQRYGRIMRPGNLFATPKLGDGSPNPLYDPAFKIRVLNYVTQGVNQTFGIDAVMWQLNEAKAKFIADLFKGKIEQRDAKIDLDNAVLTAGHFKAIATGNPQIIEQAKAAAEAETLRLVHAGWEDQVREASWMRDSAKRTAEMYEKEKASLQGLQNGMTPKGDVVTATIGDQELEGPKAIGEAILAAVKPRTYANANHPGVLESSAAYTPTLLGTMRGLSLWLMGTKDHDPVVVVRHPDDPPKKYSSASTSGKYEQLVLPLLVASIAETARGNQDWNHPQSLGIVLASMIDRVALRIAAAEHELIRYRDQLAMYDRTLTEGFGQQAEYDAAIARLDELNRALGIGEDQEVEAIEDDAPTGARDDGDDEAPRAPRPVVRRRGRGRGHASMGDYADDIPTSPGTHPTSGDTLHQIEVPELIEIATMLTGDTPKVRKLREAVDGEFRAGGITLDPELFKPGNEHALAAAIAHEIGHAADWLPDETLKRGNMLGHLRSLQGFRPGSYVARDGTTVIKDAAVRAELKALSRKWRRWDPATASKAYATYRNKATELYADALSVLLNNPGLLETDAPIFYKQFFEYLDKKPEVEDAFAQMFALFNGTPDEIVERRGARDRAMFAEGNEAMVDRLKRQREERKLFQTSIVERMRQLTNPEGRLRIRQDAREAVGPLKHVVYEKHSRALELRSQDKATGVAVPVTEDPYLALSARPHLLGGRGKAFGHEAVQPILDRLQANDLTWDDFGLAMMYERIHAGDRTKLANPHGYSPEHARDLQLKMLAGMTDDQRAALRELVDEFRAAVKDIAREAHDIGLYTDDTWKKIRDNPAYGTFFVIEQAKDDDVTSRIYPQKGTVKGIVNVADATLLKTLATIRAIEHQRAKQTYFDYLDRYHIGEIQDAKYVTVIGKNGPYRKPVDPPREDGLALVTYFEKGLLKGKYVDPYIARSLENYSLPMLAGFVKINTALKAWFTTRRVGYQLSNVIRDFGRFWKADMARETWARREGGDVRVVTKRNMPVWRPDIPIRLYWQARHMAAVRAWGLASPESSAVRQAYRKMLGRPPTSALPHEKQAFKDLVAAEKAGIISTSFSDHLEHDVDPSMIVNIMMALGVGPAPKKPRTALRTLARPVTGFAGFLKNASEFAEVLPKAAGIYEFKGEGEIADIPADVRHFIRTQLGSPDFLAGGVAKPWINNIFLFSNPQMQASRADLAVATTPTTMAGYWLKTALTNFLPKMIVKAAILAAAGAAAASGAGGGDEDDWEITRQIKMMLAKIPGLAALGRIYNKIPSYHLMNYNVLALWTDDQGHAIAARVPQDDTGRFLGGVFWNILDTMDGDKNFWSSMYTLLDYTAGQAPSLTPPLAVAWGLGQYIFSGQVRDSFRKTNLFSDTEQKARSRDPRVLPRAKKLATWALQELGADLIYKVAMDDRPGPQKTTLQRLMQIPYFGPDVLSRYLLVTDAGLTEHARLTGQGVQAERAYEDLLEQDAVNAALQTYNALPEYDQTAAMQKSVAENVTDQLYPSDGKADRKDHLKAVTARVRATALRVEAEPLVLAVLGAESNEEKVVEIMRMRGSYTPADFERWIADALSKKVISKDVVKDLRAEMAKRMVTVH